MIKRKIAIVHDYIKEYGGAERVLEALHDLYPDAPVYTSVYLPEFLGPHKKRFQNWKIKTSWFQNVPFNHKLISPFRLISSYVFREFDFSGYDVIIVSQTGAYFPNAINKRSAKQICYCHTPPRYLYGYMTARNWKSNPVFRVLGEVANHFLRMTDFEASRNVDYFIANSEEVKKRIKKFYKKEAVVINPPAISKNPKSKIPLRSEASRNSKQIINTKYKILNTEYYLTGGRLARAKGTDIVIKAFVQLGKSLKVFGRGFAGFESELKKVANNQSLMTNVQFLGEVTEKEKFELMRNARAYIFASFDEDFGITPVEAMSVGTPVIAYKSGGVKETVIDGKTGLFYEENTSESLAKVIKKFETLRQAQGKQMLKNCIKQAEKFSKENFEKRIEKFMITKTNRFKHKS